MVLVVKRSRLDVNGLVNTHLRENRSVTLRYSFTKNNNLIIDEQTDSVLFSPTLPDTIRSSYPVMSLCIKKEKAIASFTQDFYKSVKYCFDSKFKGTVIEDGDTLKLGNKILNLCFHKENEKDPNLDSDLKATLETQSFGRDLSESFNHGEKELCKICLCESSHYNEFVDPLCSCMERMPVHYTCLKKWFSVKAKRKVHKGSIIYDLTTLNCGICKKDFPLKVLYKGKQEFLLDFPLKKNKMYLMVSVSDPRISSRSLVIIGLNKSKREIFIGNDNENHINLADSSISEQHAYLEWKNKRLCVFDLGSTYGTLIKLKNDIPLNKLIGEKIVHGHFNLQLKTENKGKQSLNTITDPCDSLLHFLNRDESSLLQRESFLSGRSSNRVRLHMTEHKIENNQYCGTSVIQSKNTFLKSRRKTTDGNSYNPTINRRSTINHRSDIDYNKNNNSFLFSNKMNNSMSSISFRSSSQRFAFN